MMAGCMFSHEPLKPNNGVSASDAYVTQIYHKEKEYGLTFPKDFDDGLMLNRLLSLQGLAK